MSIDDCNKSEDEKELEEEGLKVKVKRLKRSNTKKGSMGLVGGKSATKSCGGHHNCVCNGNFQYQ